MSQGRSPGKRTISFDLSDADDGITEADGEKITIAALDGKLRKASDQEAVADVAVVTAEITLLDDADPDAEEPEPEPEPLPPLSFSEEDAAVAEQVGISGKAGDPFEEVLPEAIIGGDADEDAEEPVLVYSIVGELPAGLEFESATRTISGTPEAATEEEALTITLRRKRW